MKKTYTVDFLSIKPVVNNGIMPQHYVDNSHEAIFPREIFMQVQKELVRRSAFIPSKTAKKETIATTTSWRRW